MLKKTTEMVGDGTPNWHWMKVEFFLSDIWHFLSDIWLWMEIQFFSLLKKTFNSGTITTEDKFCRQESTVRTRPAARLQGGRAARTSVR